MAAWPRIADHSRIYPASEDACGEMTMRELGSAVGVPSTEVLSRSISGVLLDVAAGNLRR